jgi:glyoxylase-like metal-dependent hydrolase (beta-lactamase superfamily II)
VFDRERVQLWDDALDLDEVFTLETAPGHTPGHAICWLESKGERALFSGDVMHSAIQVFEPTLNSGFDVTLEEAKTSRRRVLDRCLDKDALLLPAHFSAPHAYRLRDRGHDVVVVTHPLTAQRSDLDPVRLWWPGSVGPFGSIRDLGRFRRLASARDVAHAHGLRAGALVVLAVRTLSRERRPRVVVTLHNVPVG